MQADDASSRKPGFVLLVYETARFISFLSLFLLVFIYFISGHSPNIPCRSYL